MKENWQQEDGCSACPGPMDRARFRARLRIQKAKTQLWIVSIPSGVKTAEALIFGIFPAEITTKLRTAADWLTKMPF